MKRAATLIGSSVVIKYAISFVTGFVYNTWHSIATALVYEALVQACTYISSHLTSLFGESNPQARRQRLVCAGFLIATMIICTSYMTTWAREGASPHPGPYDPDRLLEAMITRCYDGDTCTGDIVNTHPVFGNSIPIRIAGIDAPELRARCDSERVLAEKARDVVASKVVGRLVTLSNPRRDKYFRILADIETSDGDLASHLLELELAVPYDGGKKIDWCASIPSGESLADRPLT